MRVAVGLVLVEDAGAVKRPAVARILESHDRSEDEGAAAVRRRRGRSVAGDERGGPNRLLARHDLEKAAVDRAVEILGADHPRVEYPARAEIHFAFDRAIRPRRPPLLEILRLRPGAPHQFPRRVEDPLELELVNLVPGFSHALPPSSSSAHGLRTGR